MTLGHNVNALPDARRRLQEAQQKIQENLTPSVINYDHLIEKVKDMELEGCGGDFWNDQERAQQHLAEVSQLKGIITRVENWKRTTEDLRLLMDLATAEASDAGISSRVDIEVTRE